MHWTPPAPFWFAALAVGSISHAHALIVRQYDAAIHKRLLNFPQLVYHVTPSPNPKFIADATLFRGIGWPDDSKEWTRQMALVSPRHLICATHQPLNPAWRIIFAGTDGKQHLYGIESQTPIINPQGKQTDLMVVTLSAEVGSSLGITPFPVLNLPGEANYAGLRLLVCGSFVDSGTATIGGHITLTNDPGFDTTRFIYFDYNKNATNGLRDDCTFWYGDSGAPGFVMVNGRPVIAGTASGFDDLTPDDGIDGPVFRNYLASIHSYLPQVDAIMGAKGYHLKRFYPAATTVGAKAAAAGLLRARKPAKVSIATTNSGAKAAHNVQLVLKFPAAPTVVSGAGWTCKAATPLVWKCRRGGISSSTSATLTVKWNSLPTMAKLPVSITRTYDGSPPVTTTTKLPVLPSSIAWSAAADSGQRGLAENVRFSNTQVDWDKTWPAGAFINSSAYSPVSDAVGK